MNNKNAKQIRRCAEKNKNKIIVDFLKENESIAVVYVLDKVKKYKLKNRIKIAFSILRGKK